MLQVGLNVKDTAKESIRLLEEKLKEQGYIKIERPTMEETYLGVARVFAERSSCLRRGYGAVIIKNDEIIGTGYNGGYRGGINCCDRGKCKREELNVPPGERYELCIDGDTVLKLLDGKYKTIRQITKEGKDVWVYSIDVKTGKIVPALATNPRLTKKVNKICCVTLDNGIKVKTTLDHRFLMRNGKYTEAQNLKAGDSLMPMYYNFAQNKGYESISNTIYARKEKWESDWMGKNYEKETHKLVWEHFNGERDKKSIIHHINEDRNNNTPENLCSMSIREHSKYHSKKFAEKNPEHYEKMMKMGHEKIRFLLDNDESFRNKVSEHGRILMSNNWKNEDFVKRSKDRGKLLGKNIALKTNSDIVCIRNRMLGKIVKGISELKFKSGVEITVENYEELREKFKVAHKLGEKGSNLLKVKTILKYFNSLDEAIDKAKVYNHRVKCIDILDSVDQDVYDISVPIYNNFAIDLGDKSCIFLHNCESLHAESNACLQAKRADLIGSTLYLYGIDKKTGKPVKDVAPCKMCERLLKNAEVKEIKYYKDGEIKTTSLHVDKYFCGRNGVF